jgi:hypothetical protein
MEFIIIFLIMALVSYMRKDWDGMGISLFMLSMSGIRIFVVYFG